MSLLKMTASPHMHRNESTGTIMLDVIIALIPSLVWGIYAFGFRALTVTLVCVLSCVLTEYVYRKLARKSNTIFDFSAVVTGMLLAFTLPVGVPFWICVLGSIFAIALVKQLYGGIGKNVVNPALAARAFLFMAFPKELSTFVPFGVKYSLFGNPPLDAVAGSTPLVAAKQETLSVIDLFIGNHTGAIGELSEALLLFGGLYLLLRKVITWHIPVTFIATVAIVTFFFPQGGADGVTFMLEQLFSGGLFIGAFFMATDYVTSPATSIGRIIFGIGCGLITLFIRYFGGYPEGVSFAILIMNLLVWYIDMATKPRVFGGGKNAKVK